ncbi:hypothetical protein ACFQ9X_51640 [Catenulispora yoronensis]
MDEPGATTTLPTVSVRDVADDERSRTLSVVRRLLHRTSKGQAE